MKYIIVAIAVIVIREVRLLILAHYIVNLPKHKYERVMKLIEVVYKPIPITEIIRILKKDN
jgi:radical SAM superfamily enzyme